MERSAVVLLISHAIFYLLLAVPLRAQSASPAAAEDGLIKLDVVVTDKSGKPVSGLGPSDLTLLDNGQPQKLLSFQGFDGVSTKPDPPVEVILVIDAVNLSPEQVSTTKDSLEKLLRANHGHLGQPVSLFFLTPNTLSSTAAPSTDGNALADQVAHGNKLPTVRRTTVLQPGEAHAVTGEFLLTPAGKANRISLNALGAIVIEERRKPGRKILFWIGPGWPIVGGGCDVSFDFITEFSTRIREARMTLWSVIAWPDVHYQDLLVPVKLAKDAKAGNLALAVLATQSGGGVLDTAGDLSGRISRLMQQANAFYSVAFDSSRTQQVDEFHDITVTVAEPGMTARTNSAYYDQPSYHDQPLNGQRITVADLEQMLAMEGFARDKELAGKLSTMELTERLSSAKLNSWSARLPGEKSRAALFAVADRSVFLPLPPSEIPSTPKPDMPTQRLVLSRSVEYLTRTMLKLPNFFATRTTVQYDEPERKDPQLWKPIAVDETLHATKTSQATVLFRDGKEVTDAAPGKGAKLRPQGRSLDTRGTFGPILAMAFAGAAHGRSEFAWDHWERGTDAFLAVFRYAVQLDDSQFSVGFCCLADPDGSIPFEKKTGYHGEMAIDPASGAILRLTVMANLEPGLPMLFSDIMVEYGTVIIGGKTYIGPTRSVSISRQRTVTLLNEWGESFGVYGRFETILNDVAFGSYHVFRSESRMLPQ